MTTNGAYNATSKGPLARLSYLNVGHLKLIDSRSTNTRYGSLINQSMTKDKSWFMVIVHIMIKRGMIKQKWNSVKNIIDLGVHDK